MDGTLRLLYDYVQDLEFLIRAADDLAKKSILRDELSKFHDFEACGYEDISIHETEYLVSLSRILVNYGFSQTYESFKNACMLLLADYEHAKENVGMATERLKKSTSRLFADKAEVDLLWRDHEVSDPWEKLVKMLVKNTEEGAARRNFYLKRIAELASLKNLAGNTSPSKAAEVALTLSPIRLEMDFVLDDGILLEILPLHTDKTDLY